MRIYIVRHGQAFSNVTRTFNITDDINEEGIKQANILADKIKDMKFDIMYYSPIKRAYHTALILNNKLNLKMIKDDRLKERDPKSLIGDSYDSIDRSEYWNYNTKISYGTSENIKIFFARIYDFLDELKTKDYNNVLIVTHHGVSKAFESYFNGIGDGYFLNKGLLNCEIKMYEFNKEKNM